ncbi:MAG: hypothetical protein WCT85_01970 [Parachlamydiales bacterium]|jgi:hypothetical protein
MSVVINRSAVIDQENIKILSNRQRGDVYFCVDGILKKMSFIQKIVFIVSKFFESNFYHVNQDHIRLVINNLVSRFESVDDSLVTRLFFDALAPMSEKIYDRSKINSRILTVLRRSLSSCEDYRKLDKQQKDKEGLVKYIPFFFKERKLSAAKYERLKNQLLEAMLATNLGIRNIESGNGWSRTYFIRDLNHQTIGVYKPGSADSLSLHAPSLLMRVRNKILKKLGYGGSVFIHLAGKCHIAEAASFEMDDKMGTGIVPPTAVVSLNPDKYKRKNTEKEKGSFQLFVPNASLATEFFGIHKNYRKKVDLEGIEFSDELFDKLIIDDIVSGNLDRHAENFLVQRSKNNPKAALNINLIDGGMAFSPTHPKSKFEMNKQYIWATTYFQWSQRKFTQSGKEKIKDVYKRRHELANELKKFYIAENEDQDIAKERADRMIERIEMLYHLVIIKDEKKFKFQNYRTIEQMNKIRDEILAG